MSGTIRRIARAVAALAVTASVAFACTVTKSSEDKDPLALEFSMDVYELPYRPGQMFVTVSASGSWEFDIDFHDSEPWCSLSIPVGSGSIRSEILSWDENHSTEARSCTVILSNATTEYSREIVQRGKGEDPPVPPPALDSDPVPGWLELPSTSDTDLCYKNHYMEFGGRSIRNYSYLLDPDARISVWVAYPLNKSLCSGSIGRTEEWDIDPKVPRQYQSVIFSGYKGGFDRGHQLPSADRQYSFAVNAATYYGTNMTPQRGSLNQKAWATFEGKVRSWSYDFDTLYVVTGADIVGSDEYATDNDGKRITVPVGYFKALLGYKKSGTIANTGSQGGYTAIGFYFEHKAYTDAQIMSQSMTIDALEEKTGFDFFVNLPGMTDKAATIESNVHNWWK